MNNKQQITILLLSLISASYCLDSGDPDRGMERDPDTTPCQFASADEAQHYHAMSSLPKQQADPSLPPSWRREEGKPRVEPGRGSGKVAAHLSRDCCCRSQRPHQSAHPLQRQTTWEAQSEGESTYLLVGRKLQKGDSKQCASQICHSKHRLRKNGTPNMSHLIILPFGVFFIICLFLLHVFGV